MEGVICAYTNVIKRELPSAEQSSVHAYAGAGEAPSALTVPLQMSSGLRYGENPHQPASFYRDLSLAEHDKGGVSTAAQHHGKEVWSASLCHKIVEHMNVPPVKYSLVGRSAT